MKKERIDVLLVERGFFDTCEEAKPSLMAGLVLSGSERITKPGEKVDVSLPISVKGKTIPYVSRGGLKLEKAIQAFKIDLKDRIMIDIGSSTGGFTDCALQNGVKLVYAVDVGYNQLDWKVRIHEQVVVMERTNFRYATKELFTSGLPDFASIDVSFISLRLMLAALHDILIEQGTVVALIKPQFEAQKEFVGKNGIIRDKAVHQQVVEDVLAYACGHGYSVLDLTFSPIKGTEGNIEFLVYLRKTKDCLISPAIVVKDLINQAHELK
jgi:23S rRNA (cytidine1920-2'-O)/16S rRNA (cytidine1409-2'-O)-methyltransferase